MAEKWQVQFTDDDEDGIQMASFESYDDAQTWIENQKVQNRYDNVHFKVIDGPYEEKSLDEAEDENAEMSFKAFAEFANGLDMSEVQQAIVDAAIVFISQAFGVDADKFKNENPKLVKKLHSLIPVSKDKSDKAVPFLAVHYPQTGVNLLAVTSIPQLQDKSLKSILKLGWKTVKKALKKITPLGMFMKSPSTFLLVPFKRDGGKIAHDSSEKAYLQVAMALLLSDIEFDSLWPAKAIGASFMKYLDFICPSLMDVIGLATFGGASIAARAAKISAKAGAKNVAKASAKKGIKKLAKNQLKLVAKVAKAAPEGTQKALRKGHEALKKAKNASQLSRKMKNDLKGRSEELAEALADECDMKTKIWVDDIRPAPEGYVWLKSVNEFIDYMVEHGLYGIAVFDFDHDAGEHARDGGDYIKCLDWLESIGADNINVRIHSANPAGAEKMKQVIKKNEWNEVFDVIEQPLSKREQVQMLFESIAQSSLASARDWQSISKEHPAYGAVESALVGTDCINVEDVYEASTNDCYLAELVGNVGSDLDPQRWLMCLEFMKKFIAWMLSYGCGDVWLVDFNNDAPDGTFILRVGFQLLSSPFASDGNNLLDEAELDEAKKPKKQKTSSKPDASGPEDAKAKGKVLNALKDASKEFQKMAANNDPEQFAKIVVAFDDLTAGVGAYDFKEKKQLTEDDEANCKDAAKGILAALMQKLSDAGAKCTTAEVQLDGIVKVNGEFNDKIPLDCLLFRWQHEDECNPTGWHECTKCMNKWRGVGKEILDKLAPNGLDAVDLQLQEAEDGTR